MLWPLIILFSVSLVLLAYSVYVIVRIRFFREKQHEPERPHQEEHIDPFTQILTQAIYRHMSDPNLSVDLLANELNFSSSQLSRKTKEAAGESPYKLITRIRMEQAVNLMSTSSMNITEIAYKCGYHELSNFSRAFSKFWSKSPTCMMKEVRPDRRH